MPGDLVQVEVELGLLEHLEPLGVGLHQAVLDPVVDHLHEVAGAGPARRGRSRRRARARGRSARAASRLGLAAGPSGSSRPRGPRPRRRRRHRRTRSPCSAASRAPPLRVAEVRVAAVDDRVAGLGEPEQLAGRCSSVIFPAGTIIQNARGASSWSRSSSSDRGRRLDAGVVGLHVVAVARRAASSCCRPCGRGRSSRAASGSTSSSWTRAMRRPRSRSDSKSPAAWARISRAKPKGCPGIGSSAP